MELSRNEDLLLARRAAKDDAAFAELVGRYQSLVYNVALRSAASAEDAADIAQETFLKAWRSLSAFRGECALSTWLCRITLSCACDFARAKKRRAAAPLIVTDADGEEFFVDVAVSDTSALPEDAALREEEIRAVREAIASLPEDQRVIVTMRDLGEMSYAEIAETLSLELGTVKSRLFRARAAVKNFLLARNFLTQGSSNTENEKSILGK